jgi:uncharacterized membrane protein
MSDREILDAPEREEHREKLSFSSGLIAGISLALFTGFLLIFWLVKVGVADSFPSYRILYFNFDSTVLLLMAIVSFILYFFVARLEFSGKDWYRIMVISVTMVFFSLAAAALLMSGQRMAGNPFNSIKILSFVSILVGGGCSISVQFLRRKKYAFFLVAMIVTLTLFALVNYI